MIRAEEPVILYRWLPGKSLCELLEAAETDPKEEERLEGALPALCRWLGGYYAASGGLALGDAHLRNFLLLPGVFTLTYDPALTPMKRRLAFAFLQACRRELKLSLPTLERALFSQLETLCTRRRLPPETRQKYERAVRQLLV